MARALIRRALLAGAFGGSRGGLAITMLLAFIALAVPVTAGVVATAGQLSINSKVYNNRLDRLECNRSAIEHAIW